MTEKGSKFSYPKVIFSVIFLLSLWILVLSFIQTKRGQESVFTLFRPLNYIEESKKLEVAINEELVRIGLQTKSIEKASQEEVSRGRIKWVHFQKEIRVPASRPLSNYYMAISEGLRKNGGRVFECQIKEKANQRLLTLKAGIEPLLTHSFLFLQSPQVAFLIDDFGYRMAKRETGFLETKFPLTISIIPGLTYSAKIASEAEKKGKEIILHLPMEPKKSFNNDYPWIVLTSMNRKEIERAVEESLADVSLAVGLNNHMGSKATEDKEVMSIILRLAKKKNIFFIDSRSSTKSIAFKLAKKMKVKTGRRDVFLDNLDDPQYIKEQLSSLKKIALEKGQAIGIGHATRSATLSALKEFLPQFKKEGIRLVYVSELVE